MKSLKSLDYSRWCARESGKLKLTMLLTNHVLTGTLLGLSIDNEVVLVPTAIASHFVLDAMPHFGTTKIRGFRNPRWLVLGAIDFTLACGVVAAACLIWPQRAIHILLGAGGAALPDLFYIPEILFGVRLDKAIRPFHGRIQKELPQGIVTEIVWALTVIYLLHYK